MKTLAAALALAATLAGCDVKASQAPVPAAPKVDGPSYTATVKIDDV